MTDWQTGLMLQVTDPGRMDPASRFGSATAGLSPALRQVSLSRDHAGAPHPADTMSFVSVKHIRQFAQEGLNQPAVFELVALSLRRRPHEPVEAFLDTLLARGLPAEHIYLRLLQPAARHLGELWLEDTCTFVDVTLAMTVLQSGMRYLAPAFHRHCRTPREPRTIVLSTLGGDQHTFGAAMTAEFFRRSGWTVLLGADDGDALADRLRGERDAIVGFSASRVDQLPQLSAAIRQLRQLGRDRVAGILVGGPLFVARPELARETGADALGLDARHAVAEAETLVAAENFG